MLLEMNGDKWAFIKLKRDGCVPTGADREHRPETHATSTVPHPLGARLRLIVHRAHRSTRRRRRLIFLPSPRWLIPRASIPVRSHSLINEQDRGHR